MGKEKLSQLFPLHQRYSVFPAYGLTGPPVALKRLENGSFYCNMPVPIPDQFFVFCKGEWTGENQYNVTLTYKGQEIQLGQISKSKSLLIVKWKRDEKMTRPASMLFQKETILAKLVVKINEGHTHDGEISDKQEMKRTQGNKRRNYQNRIEKAPNEPSDKKQKTETTKENTRIRTPQSESLNLENDKLNLRPYDKEIDQNIVEHQESVRNEVSSTDNVEKSKLIYRKMGNMDREQTLPIANYRDTKETDATTSDIRLNNSEGETVKLDTTDIDLKTNLKLTADQNDQNITDKDFVKDLSDTVKHCFTAEKTVTINKKKKPLILIEVKVPETEEKSLNPDSDLKAASCKDISTVVYTCALCKTTFTSTANCVEHLMHAHGKDALKSEDIQILESLLKQNEQMSYKIDHDTRQELLRTERDKFGNKREVPPWSTTNEQLFKSGLFAYACTDKCNFPQHKMGHAGEKTYKGSVNENECNKSNRLNGLKITNISEDPHICDECGAIFQCYELNKFNIHKRKHKGESPYKCDICGNAFKLLSHLTMHKRIHTGEKPYKCDVCRKAFSKRCHLTTHTKIHTGEKPYKWDVCGRACKEPSELKVHKRIHTGDDSFNCDVCGQIFTQSSKLIVHKRTHTGERPYMCDVCGFATHSLGNFNRHKIIHTGEKLYKCEVCGLPCRDGYTLTMHQRIHTGEKPYKCDVCGHAFTQMCHLTRHVKIHSDEKTYVCNECGRAFSQAQSLTRHRQVHTGIKPYKCHICGYGFSSSSGLSRHKRAHTGEKPYKCDVCGSEFSQICILKRHKKIHSDEKI